MSEKGTSLARFVEHFGLEILNKGDTYDKGGLLDMLYRDAKVENVEYGETIDVTAVCPPRVLGQIADYTPDWEPPREMLVNLPELEVSAVNSVA